MSKVNYFNNQINVEGKKILIRLDLNVPLNNKLILDDTRIKVVLPFIKELLKKNSKLILLSHLGRPKGIKKHSLSLVPVYKYLKKQLKNNLYFFTGDIDHETKDKIDYLKNGEIVLIENIRFYKGEEENDDLFAKTLANLCDIYINDAFSCCHRKQASVHKITKYSKNNFAGPLIQKEIKAIDLLIKDKKEPVTCLIGGSKVSTKINVILSLIQNVNNIIILGAMANNFLVYKNQKVGKSLVENNVKEIIKKIYNEAYNNKCQILIPEDFNVSKDFNGKSITKNENNIDSDDIILDIGPKTLQRVEEIIKTSKTVMWNGPAGYFENINFAKGTNSLAKIISDYTLKKSLLSIVGGGDTISAINKSKMSLSFTHLSTAGGAFLEYLEGKDLPGISVLK